MQSDLFEKVIEGRASILVPKSSLFKRPDGVYEPSWAPVFYNPYMKDNRSLSVLASLVYQQMFNKIRTFSEPLAGICVRTIRMLLEGGLEEGYANDLNETAVSICRDNVKINGLEEKVKIFNYDANFFNYYLDSLHIPIDFVDIDPYGSPIYYLQSSIKLIKKRGLMSVTATDVGTLEGKYPNKTLSRYGIISQMTTFSKEIAARTLIYTIARFAFYLERNIKPLLSYYDRHYMKIIVKIEKSSSSEINETMKKIGYIYVNSSGFPSGFSGLKDPVKTQEEVRYIGPIWIGELCDKEFVQRTISMIPDDILNKFDKQTINKIKILLNECEIDVPYYFNLHKLSEKFRVNVPKINTIIEELRRTGHRAVRTHFDLLSIKTDAPLTSVISALKDRSTLS